jgi:hypothetical protein
VSGELRARRSAGERVLRRHQKSSDFSERKVRVMRRAAKLLG